jgi:putative transposase
MSRPENIVDLLTIWTEGGPRISEIRAPGRRSKVPLVPWQLREQGLPTDRKYLFIIDGAKALRTAIEEVFGSDQPVHLCRNHKLENVMKELPKEQQGQTRNLMRAAWKVKTAEEGEKRMEQIARLLEHDQESAARSLREGMQEMFTLQRLQIPISLHKCLATTNIIESRIAASVAAPTT